MQMRVFVAAAEGHNPILPESSEVIYPVLGFTTLLVPILVVALMCGRS